MFSPVLALVGHEGVVASVPSSVCLLLGVLERFGGAGSGAVWGPLWGRCALRGPQSVHPGQFLAAGRAQDLSQLPVLPIILIIWPPGPRGLGRLAVQRGAGTHPDTLLLSPLKARELPAYLLEKRWVKRCFPFPTGGQ